jgi:hypothetical protein
MRKNPQLRSVGYIAVSIALITCTSVGFCRSHRSNKAPTDLIVPVPSFSISVKLSDAAKQQLQNMHESILVIAYFDGDPLPGQGTYNAPFRDVFLGNAEKLVDEHNIATFDTTRISQSNWDRLADKNYFITINVVSARKASKNNLLSCSVPENRLSTFAGKTTEVSCDLISERFPVLKSLGSNSSPSPK